MELWIRADADPPLPLHLRVTCSNFKHRIQDGGGRRDDIQGLEDGRERRGELRARLGIFVFSPN